MTWFRNHLRLGSRLALLAVAIQLVLTFSHVHLDGNFRLQGYSQAVAAIDDESTPSPATTQDPFCDVCSLLQMAASLIHPDAPAPTLLQRFTLVAPPLRATSSIAATPNLSFNARAPPLV